MDTATPTGSKVFMVMAALAQMEPEIERERITDSVAKRRAVGKDLGGRRQTFMDFQIRNSLRPIRSGGANPGPRHVEGGPVPVEAEVAGVDDCLSG